MTETLKDMHETLQRLAADTSTPSTPRTPSDAYLSRVSADRKSICGDRERSTKVGRPILVACDYRTHLSILWSRRVRPERFEHATLMKTAPNPHFLEAMRKMQDGIRWGGMRDADELLDSNPVWPSTQRRVFQAVVAILYDQECMGGDSLEEKQQVMPVADIEAPEIPRGSIKAAAPFVLELMLHVDYGFPAYPLRAAQEFPGRAFLEKDWPYFNTFCSFLVATARRWKQGALPDSKAWKLIGKEIKFGLDVEDAAILLHQYDSHRAQVDHKEHHHGWTGYTGVLQQLVADVPTRGTERLLRKLSLDVHVLIPKYVKDRETRDAMISMARNLARQYGLMIDFPRRKRISEFGIAKLMWVELYFQ
ncbi:hypothetical protein MFIFM68171_10553 [Madurella fahalii]|uniref:Uncharacterized protein n=1 Tax=Madurella fahalii TaxID=1157608 RepID=A0ABQ0GRH1_9PEZI